ncbi:shikimate 5-dehydrogenase [Acerihabitans arboris]|uniref:Shikimate 5-dehydrogenase n=1 Tax=Acerihabitans arboris TaxID=2691583 RepID=A0A845SS96_9GAMM|nr:shikimate 5-dehydrogenase [Acerihabitans arboris]NDL63975.1 shikimate 5-dehydrogenase [Acerihabitans arboris]
MMNINKDTLLCMSLAARPGNFGTRFHNYLYEKLDLNYIYKAFTTGDLAAAIGGVRALGIRGCAVSMPFKEDCIPYLDELDRSARAIESVNTIVNTDGRLKAYNTDYIAIERLLAKHQVGPDTVFALRGSGGMAKAVAGALHNAGFRQGMIIARNEKTGRRLADLYGYRWQADETGLDAALLINVTPVGMAGGPGAEELSFSERCIERADRVFDVVALPAETPLIQYARLHDKAVITGAEVIAIQALEQFVLYTGVRPDDDLVERAAAHARG